MENERSGTSTYVEQLSNTVIEINNQNNSSPIPIPIDKRGYLSPYICVVSTELLMTPPQPIMTQSIFSFTLLL